MIATIIQTNLFQVENQDYLSVAGQTLDPKSCLLLWALSASLRTLTLGESASMWQAGYSSRF